MKNTNKKKLLEAAGWRVGSTDDFLDLTEEEAAYIDPQNHVEQESASMS